MDLFDNLKQKVAGANKTIVFPEGQEPRIFRAAIRLKNDGLVVPILLGKVDEIKQNAENEGVDLGDIELIDPNTYPEDKFAEMVEAFVERRKGKNTKEQAETMLRDVNYFVSGAIHSTGDTVRPALQIIKTKPGVSRTSGAFVMVKGDERYLFADCAININPGAQELAEIAVESANTAKIFDIDPQVAMLSFSTMGSAKSDEVTKVQEAVKLAKELAPNEKIDGELQFDAAFVPVVAKQKAPESEVAGHANVFVFPELQSGNIGYKIAQRLGGFEAIGPVLQGLNKPVSDLSRGSVEEDVYKVAIITAAQALM